MVDSRLPPQYLLLALRQTSYPPNVRFPSTHVGKYVTHNDKACFIASIFLVKNDFRLHTHTVYEIIIWRIQQRLCIIVIVRVCVYVWQKGETLRSQGNSERPIDWLRPPSNVGKVGGVQGFVIEQAVVRRRAFLKSTQHYMVVVMYRVPDKT